MKKQEIDYLKFLCSKKQEGLANYLNEWLVESGSFQDEEVVYVQNSFIYAQGDIPVCLVAHLDTVHRSLPSTIYHDEEKCVLWAPEGIGGDDRCGVYAILKILEEGLKPHVIFTFDEEIGGLGASVASSMLNPELNYMIEIDRRGKDDCVFYDCANKDFISYVEEFGFNCNWGTFSDISYLAPAWGCAAVNLSAGYLNEHTNQEIIRYDWLFDTIAKIKKMLLDSDTAFEYVPKDNKYYGYDYGYGGSYCGYSSRVNGRFSNGNLEECFGCGDYVATEDFDYYNSLCKKCCSAFGLKTEEERNASSSVVKSSSGLVECPKCGSWVDKNVYDEDGEYCVYCFYEKEEEEEDCTRYTQWIDEDNDKYERYSG